MIKKTRKELEREYHRNITKIWNKLHIQPSITLEYLYMKQDSEEEALEMLTQEIQRTLLYSNSLNYTDYSQSVDITVNRVMNELGIKYF